MAPAQAKMVVTSGSSVKPCQPDLITKRRHRGASAAICSPVSVAVCDTTVTNVVVPGEAPGEASVVDVETAVCVGVG